MKFKIESDIWECVCKFDSSFSGHSTQTYPYGEYQSYDIPRGAQYSVVKVLRNGSISYIVFDDKICFSFGIPPVASFELTRKNTWTPAEKLLIQIKQNFLDGPPKDN